MRSAKELIDKPVISIADGRKLGTVSDLFLDETVTRLQGLYLGSEGLLKRTRHFIMVEDVVVLGEDAILVQEGTAVRNSDDDARWEQWLRRERLRGREVTTPGGTRLARIGDLRIDDEGNVTSFMLDRVYVSGPLNDQPLLLRDAVVSAGDLERPMTANLADVEEVAGDELG